MPSKLYTFHFTCFHVSSARSALRMLCLQDESAERFGCQWQRFTQSFYYYYEVLTQRLALKERALL